MADKIKVEFELSGVDKARVEVAEFEKGLTSAQKAVVALAKADAATGASLKALEEGMAAGAVSAEEYVEALKKIAAQAPKTAAEVRAAKAAEERATKAAAAAEKKAAEEEARAAEAAAKAEAKRAAEAEKAAKKKAAAAAVEKKAAEERALAELKAADEEAAALRKRTEAVERHAEAVKRANEAAARDARSSRSGLSESLAARGVSAGGLLGAAGTVLGGAAAATAGIVAAGNASMEAAGRAERHQRALAALGGTYRLVQQATNDTVSAEDAYRAQLDLTRSGLRVSGQEFATIARFAREHKGALESNEEALQQLTEALRNGEAEGLRRFGIATQQGQTRAQTFERALRQMTRAQADSAPAARTLAEEQQRAAAAFGEGADALGRLAAHALGLPTTFGQVADAIRDAAGAVNDLVDAEERAPAQRAAQERRTRAQQSYAQGLRAVGQQADALGVDRRLLPAADTANRLTTAQLEAADARLRALASRVGNRDLATAGADFGAGARFVPTAPRSTGEQATFGALARGTSLAEVDAEARAFEANLRARRGERRGGALTRAAGARAEAETFLRGFAADLAGQVAANETRPSGAPGPRDSSPTAAAVDPLANLQARVALVRQAGQLQREALAADAAARQQALETQRFSARTEEEVFQLARRTAAERAGSLLAEETLARNQAEQLPELAEAADRIAETAQTEQKRLQAQQVARDLRGEEARLNREVLAQQLERRRVEAEIARATRDRVEAEKEARYRGQDEAANRYGQRDIAALSGAEGQADALNRARGQRSLGRIQAGVARREESDYLRSDAGQAERVADMAADAQLARERSRVEERYELQRTFTERWEELHSRQANATAMAADAGTQAFQAFGNALGQHTIAAVKGTEAVDQALQATVSDTLTAVGTQAIIKGAMEIAEGTAALAGIVTAAAAPGHFIAGAAFMGVGTLAASLGGAIAPGASSASAPSGVGGGSAAAPPSAPVGALGASNDNGRGTTEITINLGGGFVIGTSRELGEHLGRIINDPNGGVRINSSRVQRAA